MMPVFPGHISRFTQRSAVRSAVLRVVWAVVAIVASGPVLAAGPGETDRSGGQTAQSEQQLGTLPNIPDVSLMLRFDGLAGELRSPAGRALLETFDDLGLFERTRSSWASLADAIGLSGDEAIDALLAGRVLILAADADGPHAGDPAEAGRWACVMSVEPAVAKRMARSLKAAPRGSEDGRTVYAIEDGALRVVPLGGWTRLAVATPDASGLIRTADLLTASWDHTKDGLSKQVHGGGDALGTDPLGVVVYKPSTGPLVSGTVQRAVSAAESTRAGWTLRFTSSDPSASPTRARTEIPVGIDEGWYRRATADAAIAYAGPLVSGIGGSAGVGRLPVELGPLGDDLQNLRKWTGVFLPFEPPPGIIREEADHTVMISRPGRAGSAWFRVADASHAAKVGDAHVCDLVGVLAGAAAVPIDSPECTGQFPIAARRVDLTPLPADDEDDEEASVREHDFGGLGFAWGAARVSIRENNSGAKARSAEPQTWWSMHSVPAGVRPPSLAPGLSADPASPTVRFTVRPELLIDRLGTNDGLAGILTAATAQGMGGLRRIALIDLATSDAGAGRGGGGGGGADGLTTTGSLTLMLRTPAP